MANSKAENIFLEVYNILKTEMGRGKPLNYVKEILKGIRQDLPLFPAIILEPVKIDEVRHTIAYNILNTFSISITCWTEQYNIDKQIEGEIIDNEIEKGIIDIASDVMNTLSNYKNLNGLCNKIYFNGVNFSFENYPYRAAEIILNVEYTIKDTERWRMFNIIKNLKKTIGGN